MGNRALRGRVLQVGEDQVVKPRLEVSLMAFCILNIHDYEVTKILETCGLFSVILAMIPLAQLPHSLKFLKFLKFVLTTIHT